MYGFLLLATYTSAARYRILHLRQALILFVLHLRIRVPVSYSGVLRLANQINGKPSRPDTRVKSPS